jgi:hypothetical protein
MIILRTKWQRGASAAAMAMAAALAACGAEPGATDREAAPAVEQGEALALSTQSPGRAAGTWSQAGGRFTFDLTRTPSASSFRLADGAGVTKLELVAIEAERRFEINGRRITLDAAGAFALEGDAGALASLGATPEAAGLPELRRALRDAGVDERLIELVPAPAFFGAPSAALGAGAEALAVTSCQSDCDAQFGVSMAAAVIFTPWLIPTIIQIHSACLANCG